MRIVTLIFVITLGFFFSKFGFAEKKKLETQPEVCKTKSNEELSESPVQTDIPTVTIGTQVWMTKNLNVSTFRNGDPIPEAKTNEQWKAYGKNGNPTWCYYDNKVKNGDIYGKLYNWYAVNDPRGLAPKGFHIPAQEEWSELITFYLGGADIAGIKLKTKSGWFKEGNGTNSSGFSALPGGCRCFDGIDFFGLSGTAYWWSSSSRDTTKAWSYGLEGESGNVYVDDNFFRNGYSVRCLRD